MAKTKPARVTERARNELSSGREASSELAPLHPPAQEKPTDNVGAIRSGIRVFIGLRGHGARGPRYRVRLNAPDCMVIVESTTEPMFGAARFLLSKGITGWMEMWDGIRAFPRMRGDIERLAGMTVSEGKDGIALRRYVERTPGGDFQGDQCQGGQTETVRPEYVAQTSGTPKPR